MRNTARLAIPSPEDADVPDLPLHFLNRANILDKAAITDHGPLSNRPVSTTVNPGVKGRRFYAEDNGIEYLDTGTAWVEVGGRLGAGGLLIGADTNLYRVGANSLRTDDTFSVAPPAAQVGFGHLGPGESFFRFQTVDGSLQFGSGIAEADVNLYRAAADNLRTDDTFSVRRPIGGIAFGSLSGAESFYRWSNTDGRLEWGSGAAAPDTNLYRSAANSLRTDDKLIVGQSIDVLGDNVHIQGAGGGLYIGPGTDARLFRAAAGVLETGGNFRAGNLQVGTLGAAVGVENLRVIRGSFNGSTLAITNGSGFTVARWPGGGVTGDYQVTLAAAFASVPTVAVSTNSPGLSAQPSDETAGVFRIRTSNGNDVNGANFIAIGPR